MNWLMYLASSLISQALYAQEMQPSSSLEKNKKKETAQKSEQEYESEKFEYN